MPVYKRTRAEDATSNLLEVMANPSKYQKLSQELTDRRVAAEEAESQASELRTKIATRERNVLEREENSVKVASEVKERRTTLEADETAFAGRVRDIEEREAATTAMEASLIARETALQQKVDTALASVKALFVSNLRTFISGIGKDSK